MGKDFQKAREKRLQCLYSSDPKEAQGGSLARRPEKAEGEEREQLSNFHEADTSVTCSPAFPRASCTRTPDTERAARVNRGLQEAGKSHTRV